jgi:hypothetical protein
MKRLCVIALLAATLATLSGCIIVPEHRGYYHHPYWVY